MNEKQNPTTNESRDRDTGDAGESEKKAPENESAWTERKKSKVRAREAISGRMMDIFHHRSQDRSVCDIC